MDKIKSFNSSNSKEWLSSLLSYFMSIKTIDDNIESLRIELCSQNNFIPNQLFNYLDLKNKDFLLLNDFVNFLNEMKIPFEEKYLRKFIHNFDKDSDFCLNFQEFLGLILPKKNIDLKNNVLINIKKNNNDISNIISKNIKNIFGKLLCEELELVKNCIKTAKYCRGSLGFTSYESFMEIAGNDRYITEKYLHNFLTKNNININANDMHQLMFRLDADNDGKISFNEFEEIFFPMKENESTHKNSFPEENKNSDKFYTISFKGKDTMKESQKNILKNGLIDFTFGQNQNINTGKQTKENNNENLKEVKTEFNNNAAETLNGKKNYNMNYFRYSVNNTKKPKYNKKSKYSETEKIIKDYNNNKLKSLNNEKIYKKLNINNIKYTNNNGGNTYSSTLKSTSKFNINDSSINSSLQKNSLRYSNISYKSPKIKHTKSPLYYDYSTYSDEDGDEYFRQRKLRQSAKTDNDRSYRIFKNEENKIIENNNLKYENKKARKPCCGCPIFDTLCPCPVNVKSVENCICPKNIKNNFDFKSSYKTITHEELKNRSKNLNTPLNTHIFKSKSQFNFFYDNKNDNIMNERKFDEKRLYGFKNNKLF